MPPPEAPHVTERLDWRRDGARWPLREASRFVLAGGIRWHLQVLGTGPVMLMLHGTGASTHSFRDLAPLLASRFTVVVADLPGHAFTQTPPARQMSVVGMAELVQALLDHLVLDVAWIVGHSAGAAIGAQLVGDGKMQPQGLIGLNAALLPLDGLQRVLFPPVARMLAVSSLVPRLAAWQATRPGRVERLIESTGSQLDAEGIGYYALLARDVKHVSAAIDMMAHWDMSSVARLTPRFRTPLLLLVGDRDLAVPPSCAGRFVAQLPASTPKAVDVMPGLGHLAHEERPGDAARLIEDWVRRVEAGTA